MISFARGAETRPVDRACMCAGLRMCVCAKASNPQGTKGYTDSPAIQVVSFVTCVSQLFNLSAAFDLSLQMFSLKRASDTELAQQGSYLSPEAYSQNFPSGNPEWPRL